MRRVDWMRHQAAMASLEALSEEARDDGGGGGGEDRIGRRQSVEIGEHRALAVDRFKRVLLDEACPVESVGERRGNPHALRRGFRIIDKTVLLEFCKTADHHCARLLDRIGRNVEERHVPASAREYDRPGTADQTCSDHGDPRHHCVSLDSPVTATALCGVMRDRPATHWRRRASSPPPEAAAPKRLSAKEKGREAAAFL
jgi:hypothetical protein